MCGWKYAKYLSLVFISSVFFSCNNSPEEVVSDYLDYTFLDNNGREAYELLSSEDQFYVNREDFARRVKKENVLNKRILEKYEEYFYYEIIDIQESPDTVLVTVQMFKPNAINVLGDLVGYAMYTAFGTLPENQKSLAIAKKFDAIMMSKDRLLVSEEKVFKLIKEDEEHRIHLNLGYPEKLKEQLKMVDKLKEEAYSKELKGDYLSAFEIYCKALSLHYDEEVFERREAVKEIIDHSLFLGQEAKFNMLKFKPYNIEKRKAVIKKNLRGLPTRYEYTSRDYLILTFEVQNISEGQVFSYEQEGIFKSESVVTDHYGNIMRELRPGVYTDVIEGKVYNLLQPGEKNMVKVACEAPLNEHAEKFTWSILLNTDNKGTQEKVYIHFCKDQVKEKGMYVSS